MHRNRGSQCSQCQKHIEHHRKNISQYRYITKGLLEYIWQGDKDQGRTGIRLDTDRKRSGENDDTGQNSHQRINQAYTESRLDQLRIFWEVRCIGRQTTHAQTQRVEGLPHGRQKRGMIDLSKIRFKQELQTFTRIRQHQRTNRLKGWTRWALRSLPNARYLSPHLTQ